MTILPIFRPRARVKDRSPAAVGRASRGSTRVSERRSPERRSPERRSAVSEAAAPGAYRDFFRGKEEDEADEGECESDFPGFASSAEILAPRPVVTSGRS